MRRGDWTAYLAGTLGTGKPKRRRPRRSTCEGTIRLALEALEDRVVPSVARPTAALTTPQTALDAYVAAPDPAYTYSLNSTLTGTGYTDYVINMTSQTWRSSAEVDRPTWQHWLQIVVPSAVKSSTAVLEIGGGSNSTTAPTSADGTSVLTATTAGAITVLLPTVPNEPLTFAGESTPRTEDQIVAYSFNQYLNGGDQNWPLLLPMVESAVRAMDTAQSFVAAQSNGTQHIDNFIVTGASKRGWTTWLTPAVDSRVRAIVPYVFDALNLNAQIPHENDTYANVTQDVVGGFSSALQDYTNFNIFGRFNTPQGQALGHIVDPYAYISRPSYNIPKYLIDSTGDQFFAPDSAQFYFSSLLGQNYIRYVPNTDHGLNFSALQGGIGFEKAIIDGAALPQFGWTVTGGGSTIVMNTIDTPVAVKMWQATNPTNRDFRLETFGPNWTSSTLTDQGGGRYVAHVPLPATGTTAFMMEMTYTVDGTPLTFTTQVSEVPKFMPQVTVMDAGGVFNRTPFPASATATGAAGEPVNGNLVFRYYAGSTPMGASFITAPIAAGTYTVVANFVSADPNYSSRSSAPLTFTIAKATPTVVAMDAGGTYDGQPFPATAKATGVLSVPIAGQLTFTYYAGSTASGNGSSAAPSAAGTYTVVALFTSSNPNYTNGQSTPVTFTIALSSLSLYNGNYTGTYSGVSRVNNNGTITTTSVPATAFQAAINNGVITVTAAAGSGTGTVDSHGNIRFTFVTQIQGQAVTVVGSGAVTAVDPSGTTAAGTWRYYANLGNGIIVSGNGSWTASSPQLASDFDGNYASSYQGTITDNNNGTITTQTVNNTPFTSAISNGALTASFPASSGLGPAQGTVDAAGNVVGSVSYLYEGVNVTVNFSGTATRSLAGVLINGTWSFTADLGNGDVANGQGTWTSTKVLLFDGAYGGAFSGQIVTNNNGTITTTTIPGPALPNPALLLAVSNGVVTVSLPGVPAQGTGTIDGNGNVNIQVTFQSRGVTVTADFVGTAIQTPVGSTIVGTWSYTVDYGNGITETGEGAWQVRTRKRT
jgi:PhoPQ-activated pathogenicity-related protein